MKSMFLGALLASPVVALWMYRHSEKSDISSQIHPVSFVGQADGVVRVPIEVIEKGSPPKLIYIEQSPQAVPEPGMVSLLTLTGMVLVFRRQRK